MDVEHDDPHLVSVEKGTASAGHGNAVDRGFRKVLVIVRAAVDERDLYAHRSLHFEKLDGNRIGQRSMRINKQWRVIAELRGEAPNKRIGIVAVEDYH